VHADALLVHLFDPGSQVDEALVEGVHQLFRFQAVPARGALEASAFLGPSRSKSFSHSCGYQWAWMSMARIGVMMTHAFRIFAALVLLARFPLPPRTPIRRVP